MTDRALRKMNRRELIELLLASEKENNQLKEQLEQQTIQLQSKKLQIQNAGSMAEAALVLNGVFESADKAVEQYIENIRLCGEQQKTVYDRIVVEATQKANEILDSAEKEKQKRIDEAEAYRQNLVTELETTNRDGACLQGFLSILRKKSKETVEKGKTRNATER